MPTVADGLSSADMGNAEACQLKETMAEVGGRFMRYCLRSSRSQALAAEILPEYVQAVFKRVIRVVFGPKQNRRINDAPRKRRDPPPIADIRWVNNAKVVNEPSNLKTAIAARSNRLQG
jgi:hypothetical protein